MGERGTVIGCVHGAWWTLCDELDDPPTYAWCEREYLARFRQPTPVDSDRLTTDLRTAWEGSRQLDLWGSA